VRVSFEKMIFARSRAMKDMGSTQKGVFSSKYVDEFKTYRIYKEFGPGEKFDKIRRKNTFWKEITEAIAVRNRIKRFILRNKDLEIKYVLDLGCGKGLLTLLTALFHKDLHIYCIDTDETANRDYMHHLNNASFVKMDIKSPQLEEFIASLDGNIIMTGIHLCTDLSIRFLELHRKFDKIKFSVLVPCCIGKFPHSRFRFIIREMGIYEGWCAYLSCLAGPGKVIADRDTGILSDKNIVISIDRTES